MDGTVASWLLAGIPLLGAAFGFAVWSRPHYLRNWSVVLSILSLVAAVGMSRSLVTSPENLLLVYLLPVAACASLLGQPIHKNLRLSWITTLLFLGLGFVILTSQNVMGQVCLLVLLSSLIALLYRHHTPLWPISWLGIGAYALAAGCVTISLVVAPPLSSVASLLACAVLLPLMPFHQGHITALTRLPGGLPSFIVLLFPDRTARRNIGHADSP